MEAKAHNCLTREEKKLIYLHKEGKSYSEIAGIIRRSKSAVYRVISRTSRPPMTTKREDRMIVKMSLKDRFDTTTSISRAFCEQTGNPISNKTVYRRLNKEKLLAKIPCRKPLISKKNQKVRLDFTTEYILWIEEQWNMIHFSDEFKFNLFGSDGKGFVRGLQKWGTLIFSMR